MLDVGAAGAGLAALLLCTCSLQLAFGAGPKWWDQSWAEAWADTWGMSSFPTWVWWSSINMLQQGACGLLRAGGYLVLSCLYLLAISEISMASLLCEERVNLSPVGQGFEGVRKGKWSLAMWHQLLVPSHSFPINVKLGFIHLKQST